MKKKCVRCSLVKAGSMEVTKVDPKTLKVLATGWVCNDCVKRETSAARGR